jgi:ElaB/YqjD/DUF883 family membrane-anchored ribosome-binding protein
VRDRASNLAGRTRDAASNVGQTVASRARGAASTVSMRTQQGRRRLEDAFEENPLAVGAVTVALGVVAGLAAPRTDREVRLFGDARERVADRARDVVDEAKERAQHVASRVVDETKRVVKDVARDEGLTGKGGAQGSTTGDDLTTDTFGTTSPGTTL